MIDTTSISTVGVVIVVGIWAIKELFYDKSRKINHKVDSEVCAEKHNSVNTQLQDIKGKVDEIYNFLLKR